MMTLLIISVLLVMSFVGVAIWMERELPESVSALVYLLPEKGGIRWLWTLWMWAVALTIAPSLMEALDGSNWQFIGFMTIASLIFTGAWPLFQTETRGGHYFLAMASGILSQLCVLLIDADWLFAWALFVFLMGSVYIQPEGRLGKAMKGKGVFLAEAVCFISLVGALLVRALDAGSCATYIIFDGQ